MEINYYAAEHACYTVPEVAGNRVGGSHGSMVFFLGGGDFPVNSMS